MAFVSATSDKSKAKAKKLILFGGIGLQYYYVGRIKAGLLRTFFGLVFYIAIIGGIVERIPAMIGTGIALLIVVNLIEFIHISLGKFRDNIGSYLRQ